MDQAYRQISNAKEVHMNRLISATLPLVLVLLTGLGLTLQAGCNDNGGSAGTSTQASEPPFSPDIQDRLEKVVDDNMKTGNIPGVIVGVWAPGKGTWIEARGVADKATGRELLATDKVRIASVTKTFTATAVLQLVDEGKLSLESKLAGYVSGVPNGDQITIRQLLNMTGGIYSFSDDPAFNARFEQDPLWKFTHEDMMQIVLRHEPDFAPGSGWSYSDTNYELLGMIIEKVTNNHVESEIQKRVIDRLGLVHTSFPTQPDMVGEYSRGYYLPAGGSELVDYTLVDPSVAWAGGAVVSNLYDLKVYAKALATGTLISKQMQEQRLAWVPFSEPGKLDTRYGLGIGWFGGYIGHNGAIFGYNSAMFYLPAQDATFVVLTNKSDNASQEAVAIFLHLAKIVYPETLPTVAPPA